MKQLTHEKGEITMPDSPLVDTPWPYDNIQLAETFADLPEEVQEDLLTWNNVRKEDDPEQLERLRLLYVRGKFQAWDCPKCGVRVFEDRPDSWDLFQGTLNQDFCYFGNRDKYTQEYLGALCDSCRCNSQ